MNRGYVDDLLGAVDNLQLFRSVAHRVAGFLARKYVEKYPLGNNTVLLPVLRAGDALKGSFLKIIFPAPRLYCIAVKRDCLTLKPKVLYKTFGEDFCSADDVIILEPMLATGGTMTAVVNEINKSFNPKKIVVVSAFVSKQAEELLGGIVHIMALSKGHDLNDKGYILIPDPYDSKKVVTLDFGDQYCGTYFH